MHLPQKPSGDLLSVERMKFDLFTCAGRVGGGSMSVIKLVVGIVAIAIGLPLIAGTIFTVASRENENTNISQDPPFKILKKLISPTFGLGIFIENLADMQEKGGNKALLIVLAVGMLLCIGGYLALTK
jgi:hypothetical protein